MRSVAQPSPEKAGDGGPTTIREYQGVSQELYVPTTSSTSLSKKSISEDASIVPLEHVMTVGKDLGNIPERPSPRLMVCQYPGVEVRSTICNCLSSAGQSS